MFRFGLVGAALIIVILAGVLSWYTMRTDDSGGVREVVSPDGTIVLSEFQIPSDSWCEENPVFCESDAVLDKVMCWMPSTVLLPAAGSGACWSIATMEVGWFNLRQDLSFLPDLNTLCRYGPFGVSGYFAGLDQNRKAIENVLGSLIHEIETRSLKPDGVCEGMKQCLRSGEPALVVLTFSRPDVSGEVNGEAAHAVVAFGYNETGDTTRFFISDSNTARPHETSEELIYQGDEQTWRYDASYDPGWTDLSVGYLRVSALGVPVYPSR